MADKNGQTPSFEYSFGQRTLVGFFKFVNRFVSWDKLPGFIGVLNLLAFRFELRAKNLYDGYAERPPEDAKASGPMPDHRFLYARNSDGGWNSLEMPKMGCANLRFGRNVPRSVAKKPTDEELMTPNPRLVSDVFMKRTAEEFKPATTLNLLAAAWIQFQIHDWVFHKEQFADNFEIPLPPGDQWSTAKNGKMLVPKTPVDKVLDPSDKACPGYINTSTPWWDASQIYGESEKDTRGLRSLLPDGKLKLTEEKHESFLPRDPKTKLPLTGLNKNWWIGLEILTTLFAMEHNNLCDLLRSKHEDWSGEEIFDKARLINCALMAKIHTVEWTPAILAHPALKIGMAANWWGLIGETLTKLLGRIGHNEVFNGIPGSGADQDGVPYSLTEEFTSVYRLHTLIPDNIAFFNAVGGEHKYTIPIQDVAFDKARDPLMRKTDAVTFSDTFYSFGINYPGAIRSNNYPTFLRDVKDPSDKVTRDMGTIDVLRDRERGVPRYCEMRRQLHMPYPTTFVELAGGDEAFAKKLEDVYGDVEKVDMIVGCQCEPLPKGFGFSDTQFRIFILMASRRLKSDRFIATQFNKETYTEEGLHYLTYTTMKDVLVRHFPELADTLKNQANVFAPWPQKPASKQYSGRETNVPPPVVKK